METRLRRRSNVRVPSLIGNALGPDSAVDANGINGSGNGNGGGSKADVTRFSESQLIIRKVTLSHVGEYRCIVTNPSPISSSTVIPKIERIFQLNVIRK